MTESPYRSANTKAEPFRKNSTMVRRAIGFFCLAVLAALPAISKTLHVTRRFYRSGFMAQDWFVLWGVIFSIALCFTLFFINIRRSYRAQAVDIAGLITILPVGLFLTFEWLIPFLPN
jgi:hypothetical protein